jgi:polyhydroxyalkanoate synthesis regulator phasin
MKTRTVKLGAIGLALLLTVNVHGQNVGIGFTNPQSKLTVNGNLAVGADYNSAAPANGALFEGYVGIGTTSPVAPLHVNVGTGVIALNGAYTYFDAANSTLLSHGTDTGDGNISGIFEGKVYANTIVAYGGTYPSDARLKNIIGRSDSAKDLETLEKIEITDYTMKDTVTFGTRPIKKVIAQQVKQAYPAAVQVVGAKAITFTPDIYTVSDSVKSEKPGVYMITLAKTHGLQDGDRIRLITEKNHSLSAVARVLNDRTFTVETKEPLGEKVFVYGKECTDLQGVDYDAISMLNVSATQELAKQVETLKQQNSDLQNETKRLTAVEGQERATISEQGAAIAALKAANEKLSAVESENSELKAEMDVLKKAVATIQEKENSGVRTVALQQ